MTQREQVLNQLRMRSPLSPKDIAKKTKLPAGSISNALHTLVRKGDIRRLEFGKYEFAARKPDQVPQQAPTPAPKQPHVVAAPLAVAGPKIESATLAADLERAPLSAPRELELSVPVRMRMSQDGVVVRFNLTQEEKALSWEELAALVIDMGHISKQ